MTLVGFSIILEDSSSLNSLINILFFIKGFIVEDAQHVQGFPLHLAASQISTCYCTHHDLFTMEGVTVPVWLASLSQQLLRKPLHIIFLRCFFFFSFSFSVINFGLSETGALAAVNVS